MLIALADQIRLWCVLPFLGLLVAVVLMFSGEAWIGFGLLVASGVLFVIHEMCNPLAAAYVRSPLLVVLVVVLPIWPVLLVSTWRGIAREFPQRYLVPADGSDARYFKRRKDAITWAVSSAERRGSSVAVLFDRFTVQRLGGAPRELTRAMQTASRRRERAGGRRYRDRPRPRPGPNSPW